MLVEPSRRRTLAVLGLSTGVHMLATLQVFTVPAIAPAMATGLGVSESLVGVQVILVYATAMVTSLFAGSLVVRLGALRATQLSVVGAAAALATAAIPSLPVVVIASVMFGASYGLVNPATGQMLESAAPPARRALLFSIKQSAVPFGGILAGVIAPFVTVYVGWQGALLTIAAISVVIALLIETSRRWFPHRRRAIGQSGVAAVSRCRGHAGRYRPCAIRASRREPLRACSSSSPHISSHCWYSMSGSA